MPPISEITAIGWVVLVVCSVIVGLTKTGLPGLITLAIAGFAAVLPAKASTSALLLVLIIGDIFAVTFYRQHTNWRVLLRLLPAVAVGIALGAVFLGVSNDEWVQKGIAIILLLLVGFTLWQRKKGVDFTEQTSPQPSPLASPQPSPQFGREPELPLLDNSQDSKQRHARFSRVFYGTLSGFTTMIANAGGPVVSLYFLAARFQVLMFLGTAAWFFAVVNLSKVPVAIGLGILTFDTLLLALVLSPAVVIGALLGRFIALRIHQSLFDAVVIAGTILGSLYLLVS